MDDPDLKLLAGIVVAILVGAAAWYYWDESFYPELFQVYPEDRHQFADPARVLGPCPHERTAAIERVGNQRHRRGRFFYPPRVGPPPVLAAIGR